MTQTLVTVQEYRDVTKDTTTAASAVEEALDEAVDLLDGDEGLQRKLQNAEYTETLEVWYDDAGSYVYPLATPITSVPASATYVVDVGARRLRGVTADDLTLWTWPLDSSFFGDYSQRPVYATVTYTGGFTHDTLPRTLRRAISRLANSLTQMNPQRAAVAGAQSVSVGDVSVTYPKFSGSLDELVPGLSLSLKPYKRKRVRF